MSTTRKPPKDMDNPFPAPDSEPFKFRVTREVVVAEGTLSEFGTNPLAFAFDAIRQDWQESYPGPATYRFPGPGENETVTVRVEADQHG